MGGLLALSLLGVAGCKDSSKTATNPGTTNNQTAEATGAPGTTADGGTGQSDRTGSSSGSGVAPPYDANSPTVKIGAYFSLTGSEATFGINSVNGIKMAFEEVNDAGGVLGKNLELVVKDTASRAADAGTVVKQLVYQDKVLAVLGEVASSASMNAAPVCRDAQVPMLSPSSTNPDVTTIGGPYVFRSCFIDPFQGVVLSRFARETLKAKKAAILTETSSDYSKGLTEVFREDWKKNGGTIVAEQSYEKEDKSFRGQLTAIKGKAPDVLFVPGYYTQVGNIAVQARSSGLKATMLGGDGWESPKLFDIAQTQLQGSYFSTHYSPESKAPQAVAFVSKYKAKYGQAPDGLAAVAYDAGLMMADAIKRAGALDRAKLREALARTKDFKGVTGNISMDANRNAVKPAVILKIQGKAATYVTTINP
jgi:branched-chain amino acid transport system substrate-binding protein